MKHLVIYIVQELYNPEEKIPHGVEKVGHLTQVLSKGDRLRIEVIRGDFEELAVLLEIEGE